MGREDRWFRGWRGVHIGDSEIAGPWPSVGLIQTVGGERVVADGDGDEERLRVYLELGQARHVRFAPIPLRQIAALRRESTGWNLCSAFGGGLFEFLFHVGDGEVDEGADAGGEEAVAGVDDVDGEITRAPFWQDADEAAGGEVIADEPVGKDGDAETGAGGFHGAGDAFGDEYGGDGEEVFFSLF